MDPSIIFYRYGSLRHREVKKLAQSHTTGMWQNQVVEAGRMVSEFRLLTNKENKNKNKKGFEGDKKIDKR